MQQQIEKDLEDVCSLLPGSLADTCKSLVQQYTPQLIQMLINKEDPETVCKQVGLCQGKLCSILGSRKHMFILTK